MCLALMAVSSASLGPPFLFGGYFEKAFCYGFLKFRIIRIQVHLLAGGSFELSRQLL